ncbi:MAG TPA: hypothetical protein VFH39_04880 [Candidatus Saccharimonadales bacterium]|nr:hypothetical protein [Candidatus Saccharimonadales bacterium]
MVLRHSKTYYNRGSGNCFAFVASVANNSVINVGVHMPANTLVAEDLFDAHRTILQAVAAEIEFEHEYRPHPFNAQRALEANNFTSEMLHTAPVEKLLSMGRTLLVGELRNQAIRNHDRKKDDLWSNTMDARLRLEELESELAGQVVLVEAVEEGSRPIEHSRRIPLLGARGFIAVNRIDKMAGRLGLSRQVGNNPTITFGERGSLISHRYETHLLDPQTLEPLVSVEFL